jgi:hypothetical protein
MRERRAMRYERPAVIGRRDITAELASLCQTSGGGVVVSPKWRRTEKEAD